MNKKIAMVKVPFQRVQSARQPQSLFSAGLYFACNLVAGNNIEKCIRQIATT